MCEFVASILETLKIYSIEFVNIPFTTQLGCSTTPIQNRENPAVGLILRLNVDDLNKIK